MPDSDTVLTQYPPDGLLSDIEFLADIQGRHVIVI